MTGRININVADIRREPTDRSERVSQGLFNEIVEVIEDGEKMHKVRFLDGYEGWIIKQFVSEHEGFYGQGPYVIDSGLAPVLEKAELPSKRLTLLPYGAKLYGAVEEGFLRINTERYGNIYISGYNIIGGDELPVFSVQDSYNLQREAEKFLGAPYLWGGRSMFGVDCSGFVGLIAAQFGVTLPRDTKDQIKFGTQVAREDIIPGDQLFFPGHVALAITNTQFIHSSRTNGGVAYNSLDYRDKLYNESLDKSLVTVRRIFA